MLWTILGVMVLLWAFGQFAATGSTALGVIAVMALALLAANAIVALAVTRNDRAAVPVGDRRRGSVEG